MLNWNDPRLSRLERAGRAAWIWDARARQILWATNAAAELWGVDDPILLIGKPFGLKDPTASDLDLAASALAHGEGIETEMRLVLSGRTRTIPIMARRFAKLPSGDLVLFTQQDEATRAARTNHPASPLLGTFPLGLALFTPAGELIYANPVFERQILRRPNAQLSDLVGGKAAAERFIRTLLAAGALRVSPTISIDGEERTLEIDAALAEDPRNKRAAIFVKAEDISARRAIERRSAERAQALKDMLGEAIEGWAILDASTRITGFGGRLLEDAPFAEEALGRPWKEAARVFALRSEEEVSTLAQSGEPLRVKIAHEAATIEVYPITDEDGAITGYHVFLRPTRAAGRMAAAEPAARLEDELFPVLAHDNFEIIYASAPAAKLFGAATPQQLVGKPLLDLFKDDERQAAAHYDELLRNSATHVQSRLIARTLSGEKLHLDGRFRLGMFGTQKVVIAGFTDIAPLVAAEERLSEDREDHAPLFSATPYPVLLIDRHGRIIRANAEAEKLLGLSEGELAERPLEDLIDKADRAGLELRRSAAFVVQPGEITRLEVRMRIKSSAAAHIELQMRALGAGEGELLVGMQDLSVFKAREEELQKAITAAEERSQQKSNFLSAVSHEMRTPLNAIIGFSEFMREGRLGPIGNEKYAGYVTDIFMSGQHLLSLVNDLLDMSKIEAGKLELDLKPTDISSVMEQCLRILSPQAEKKGVVLAGSFPRALPRVMADQRSLRQIVLNLLSNAVKFTPSGGRVIARASYDSTRGLIIEVEDTGIGMSEEEITAALEPYRQLRGRAANDELGTGLGLPLAKALTVANHASFRIQSERDKGTRVEIVFPVSQIQADGTLSA